MMLTSVVGPVEAIGCNVGTQKTFPVSFLLQSADFPVPVLPMMRSVLNGKSFRSVGIGTPCLVSP